MGSVAGVVLAVSATPSKSFSGKEPSISDSSSEFLTDFASMLDRGVPGGVAFSSGKHLSTTTSMMPMYSPSYGARCSVSMSELSTVIQTSVTLRHRPWHD